MSKNLLGAGDLESVLLIQTKQLSGSRGASLQESCSGVEVGQILHLAKSILYSIFYILSLNMHKVACIYNIELEYPIHTMNLN
jgi:hypothetical protein